MHIQLVLGVSVASFVFELLLYMQPMPWGMLTLRRVGVGIVILLCAFATTLVILRSPNLWGLLFTLITLTRIINMLRVAENRMRTEYLHRVTLRTSVILLLLTGGMLGYIALSQTEDVTSGFVASSLAVIQLIASGVLFFTAIRRMNKTRSPGHDTFTPGDALPSLTVAIPARNETDELEQFLQALVASDYPKLEILVLDDCSQTRQTPAIIRDFAHAGVRFLQGEPPHESWSAKNHAYAQLAQEASGELILFMGVDVIVEPHTLRELVQTLLDRKKRMISVLPLRYEPKKLQISLTQAARYMWELAPPRKLFKRPAVFSSCWMIYHDDLKKYGGFAAVSRMVVPEAYFARRAMTNADSYSLIRSNAAIGLYSAKSLRSQRNTAIRVRYPSLHRRPEVVLGVAVAELLLIIGAPICAIMGWFGYVPPIAGTLSAIATALFISAYCVITVSTGINSWYLAPFLAIPAAISDLIVMVLSMWQYEFSTVLWKGRNVCMPVMHVYPRLPDA